MTKKRLTLIHTSGMMIPVFRDLCSELLPAVEAVHMVDESLLKDILRDNGLSKPTARRVVGHILSADQAGTDFILVTCSSIGPATDLGRQLVDAPVMRVDEPMADLVVAKGPRIGVIATLSSTLTPTADLIRAKAAAQARDVRVVPRLCEGAFQAVIAGDAATHDRIVASGIQDMARQSDVIVLAQASMARVVQTLPQGGVAIPILASPRLAIEHLTHVL
ncbi:MAG: Asp/Glu/hydantoin racemase [Phycisphaerae bacterium]|nr:Asp/Glu/hydantoin racemase [Phycisphaerae bacterium]